MSTTQAVLRKEPGVYSEGTVAPLPSETANQGDSGSGQGLCHGCLYQPLQSLRVRSTNGRAQVLVILEPYGQQACVPYRVPTPRHTAATTAGWR